MKKILSICIAICFSISYAFASPSTLIPVGQTAGVKILCDGVIISGITNVSTENGDIYPAKSGGLAEGDIIKEINGICVYTNEQASELISNSDILDITFERNGEIKSTCITAALDSTDGQYKIGVWIRDSLAGIGTITYIDPETYEYAALGHSVSDSSTGALLPIKQGELISSSVAQVSKGENGNPGALYGEFDLSDEFATITTNTNQGIHGYITDYSKFDSLTALDVAEFSEIECGTAYILSNVSGSDVSSYSVEILSVDDKDDKNFILKVTDETLLELTGGIVQGMSGSPIIQNDKIIGAVTHVFVNDPTSGYGIYIGNMLSTAESIE